MSDKPTISIQENRFPLFRRAFNDHIVSTINDALNTFVGRADRVTPVRTGHMRSNKTVVYASGNRHEGTVTYNAHYAMYVHEGTVRQGANPWARQTADAVQPEFRRRMGQLPIRRGV